MQSDAGVLTGTFSDSNGDHGAPCIAMRHLQAASRRVRPSVSRRDAARYERLRDRLHASRLHHEVAAAAPSGADYAATEGTPMATGGTGADEEDGLGDVQMDEAETTLADAPGGQGMEE
jgi:hypothetical protein